MRRKLKVKAGKSKVMVFEIREIEMVHFNTPYTECTRKRKMR